MDRSEHLQWCKDRAMEYVKRGDIPQAFASMTSDLGKHPDTQGHPAIQLGAGLIMLGEMKTAQQARDYIEGFN